MPLSSALGVLEGPKLRTCYLASDKPLAVGPRCADHMDKLCKSGHACLTAKLDDHQTELTQRQSQVAELAL